MAVWIFSIILSEIFSIIRRNEREMITNVHRTLCMLPVVPLRVQWKYNFLGRCPKNTQTLNFIKIPPMEIQVILYLQMNWQKYRYNDFFFRNFEKTSKNHSGSIVLGPLHVRFILHSNLLNPTGHVMHQQFNIQQLYVLPTLYLCVLYLSENKKRLVPITA